MSIDRQCAIDRRMSEPASIDQDRDESTLRPRQLELLAELEAFFFTHGYRAATMDRLAQEMRCSKRTLYALAPSRKALFTLIVDNWAERIRRLGLEADAREVDVVLAQAAGGAADARHHRGLTGGESRPGR